jgi:cytidine deaminase
LTDATQLIAAARSVARPLAPSGELCAGDVGAAILSRSGRVYTGVCIDTASSLGFCAEHAAIAEMLKAQEAEVAMVVAVTHEGAILPPCGRCRELLWQLHPANARTQVVLASDRLRPLAELLPDR